MLHHEELLLAFTEVVAYLGQHRVTHTGQDTGFALKCVAEGFVSRKKRPFERDGAAKSLVHSEIDFTHPAFSDQMHDQIAILDQRILG